MVDLVHSPVALLFFFFFFSFLSPRLLILHQDFIFTTDMHFSVIASTRVGLSVRVTFTFLFYSFLSLCDIHSFFLTFFFFTFFSSCSSFPWVGTKNGLYCGPDPDSDLGNGVSGVDVVMEVSSLKLFFFFFWLEKSTTRVHFYTCNYSHWKPSFFSFLFLFLFLYLLGWVKHVENTQNLRQLCIWNTLQEKVDAGTAERTELMKWWYVFHIKNKIFF